MPEVHESAGATTRRGQSCARGVFLPAKHGATHGLGRNQGARGRSAGPSPGGDRGEPRGGGPPERRSLGRWRNARPGGWELDLSILTRAGVQLRRPAPRPEERASIAVARLAAQQRADW
ncbi:unnamed protein product [Heterosigma akashiwo]